MKTKLFYTKHIGIMCFIYFFVVINQIQGQSYDFVVANDGVWTWYNDERAIGKNDRLYSSYVKRNGTVGLTVTNLATGSRIGQEAILSTWKQVDDHNNASILLRQDGKIMAFYSRHNNMSSHSYRTSKINEPTKLSDWNSQITKNTGTRATYNNVFQLSAESGKIYNFMRTNGFNPNWKTFNSAGNQLTSDRELISIGTNSTRPYVKYTSNNVDRIDFFFTDGHPRNFNNNLYHCYYKNGNFHQTDGSLIKSLSRAPLQRSEVNRLYTFGSAHPSARPWTHSINYDQSGNPVVTYSLQVNINNITYYYAKWNPTTKKWNHYKVADAGDGLYRAEDDYTGIITTNPYNTNEIFMSTEVDPRNSRNTNKYEIYKGTTSNGGQSFTWQAITEDSSVNNLRPFVPKNITSNDRVLLWFSGTYNSYTNYNTKIVAKYLNRSGTGGDGGDGGGVCGYTKLPGTSRDIGSNGTHVYRAGTDGNLYKYNDTNNWTLASSNKKIKRLDVAPNGDVWAIGEDNRVWQYKPGSNRWLNKRGAGKDIAVGNDSSTSIFVVDGNNNIKRYTGFGTYSASFGTQKGTDLDVSKDGQPWIRGTNGFLYEWTGERWIQKGTLEIKDIGIDPDGGQIVVCDASDNIQLYTASGSYKSLSGQAVRVTVTTSSIPWVVNRSGSTYQRKCAVAKAITDIEKVVSNGITVSPNPTKISGSITLTGMTIGDIIHIYNITGQKLMQFVATSENEQVSLNGFSSGTYFVKSNSSIAKLLIK